MYRRCCRWDRLARSLPCDVLAEIEGICGRGSCAEYTIRYSGFVVCCWQQGGTPEEPTVYVRSVLHSCVEGYTLAENVKVRWKDTEDILGCRALNVPPPVYCGGEMYRSATERWV